MREWRNNKACCAARGMAVDESILDEPPSTQFPSAQFSIGNEFGYRFKSIDSPHFVQPHQSQEDNRPDLWRKPLGNWATLVFNGLNCHHTNEKNWVRAASFDLINSQFSDNSRGWTNKGTGPVWGSRKHVRNCTFVGYTRNTGHRTCRFPVGKGLLYPRACQDTAHSPVDLIDLRPQTEVLVSRRVFWFKVETDVYRLSGQDIWYPWQGLSLYDTHVPQLIENCTFINYPSPDPITSTMR